MSGRRGPKRALDDEDLRNRLLDAIRLGHGRYAAATAVGITTTTFRKYYRDSPEFREEVAAAEDSSVEPVLHMLREEAMAGDITAAKEYLKHVAPPPRSEGKSKVEVEHTHALDPATINSIAELQARLQDRPAIARGEEVIDVEVLEED